MCGIGMALVLVASDARSRTVPGIYRVLSVHRSGAISIRPRCPRTGSCLGASDGDLAYGLMWLAALLFVWMAWRRSSPGTGAGSARERLSKLEERLGEGPRPAARDFNDAAAVGERDLRWNGGGHETVAFGALHGSSQSGHVDLARTLVEGRLAACVNITGALTSIYRWRGQVTEDEEVLMIIKTTADRVQDLTAAIMRGHEV